MMNYTLALKAGLQGKRQDTQLNLNSDKQVIPQGQYVPNIA